MLLRKLAGFRKDAKAGNVADDVEDREDVDDEGENVDVELEAGLEEMPSMSDIRNEGFCDGIDGDCLFMDEFCCCGEHIELDDEVDEDDDGEDRDDEDEDEYEDMMLFFSLTSLFSAFSLSSAFGSASISLSFRLAELMEVFVGLYATTSTSSSSFSSTADFGLFDCCSHSEESSFFSSTSIEVSSS